MDHMRNLWTWAKEAANQRGVHTIALFVGIAAAIIGSVWAIYTYKPAPPDPKSPININIQLTQEQFDNFLKGRTKEILGQMPQADPVKRDLQEKELAGIKSQFDNPQKAFEEQKARLAGAYPVLYKYHPEVPAEQIETAQKALARGDTGTAEKLFQQALEKSTQEAEKSTKEAEKRTAEAAEAAYQLGSLAEGRIDYGQADKYYRQAVQLQPDNPFFSIGAGKMAFTLGHYDEAEQLLKRALLEIGKHSWEPIHLELAICLNDIAAIYVAKGKYIEADSFFRRALAIQERILGNEHPDVATSLNNLAAIYYAQEKYKEAEPLSRRALNIQEEALGPEHPGVATSLSNLAAIYCAQEKYKEAESLNKRAMAIREGVLGPEHPDVATNLNNLALLYNAQGKYSQAEPLYKRALAINEKALGPEHPNVATSLNNLAVLYGARGMHGEAEPLYKRSLAIKEKSLGPEHPSLATSLEYYAVLLKKMGRDAEAEPLEARARAIQARHAEKNPPK